MLTCTILSTPAVCPCSRCPLKSGHESRVTATRCLCGPDSSRRAATITARSTFRSTLLDIARSGLPLLDQQRSGKRIPPGFRPCSPTLLQYLSVDRTSNWRASERVSTTRPLPRLHTRRTTTACLLNTVADQSHLQLSRAQCTCTARSHHSCITTYHSVRYPHYKSHHCAHCSHCLSGLIIHVSDSGDIASSQLQYKFT